WSAARTSIAVSLLADGSAIDWPLLARASSASSFRHGVVGRAARRRMRSRAALTTILCNQVVTAESPRKPSAFWNAAIIASCRASAASSGSPSEAASNKAQIYHYFGSKEQLFDAVAAMVDEIVREL